LGKPQRTFAPHQNLTETWERDSAEPIAQVTLCAVSQFLLIFFSPHRCYCHSSSCTRILLTLTTLRYFLMDHAASDRRESRRCVGSALYRPESEHHNDLYCNRN